MNLINMIVAQVAAQGAQDATVSTALSVWDLTLKGGWLMIPLALLLLVSIYIFFERLFATSRVTKADNKFLQNIKNLIQAGKIEEAKQLCDATDTPYSRMIEKGVSRIGRPMNDVLVAIENVGNMEIAKMEKGFNWLATTAAGAPMIGFLGTVTGMVQAFYALASAGQNSNVSILASGIYEALVTTVAGLVVGILALFAYNYLTSRVNKIMNRLEGNTMEFMPYSIMALKRQHKSLSMFSMASMTDVIFLLLIFFMVTSTFVFPSAMEVNLPQSSQQTAIKPTTRIYIDKDMNMFATQADSVKQGELMPLPDDQLYGFLQAVKQSDPTQFIALHADQAVPYGKIVDILDKGSKVGIKVVLATKPASEGYASPEPEQPAQEGDAAAVQDATQGSTTVTEIPADAATVQQAQGAASQPAPTTTVTEH